jgi:ABC-type uncharacterized transport system permease subunit
MILSTHPLADLSPLPQGAMVIAVLSIVLYAVAVLPLASLKRWSALALALGWGLHAVLLVVDIGGIGQPVPGTQLGFAPVLSMTVWLVIAVHAIESRFVPLPSVRLLLAVTGATSVLLTLLFPGEHRPLSSALAPLHFALGVGSYGLFGAAVMHAVMLNQAERSLRAGGPQLAAGGRGQTLGMPLLQLERLTFRFVEAGFAVLTATLLLGLFTSASSGRWAWDHKTVFSLLAWGVFAALVVGRRQRGWRGRRATRWLYAGALLLLLAYVGSRFVLEVLLAR